MPNHLIHETSPYLLQHAHNPVEWYPWGEEAFQKAKNEGKPVLVSIGYAACHWCHVMERESFENEATAAIMNRHFINIKIDREERPDLDHIYMDAVQAMVGSGGWPLNVFLTPEKMPFYGGTYFPPHRVMNRPSWAEVLQSVATAFKENRSEIEQQAGRLNEHLFEAGSFGISFGNETNWAHTESLDIACANLLKQADSIWGGFGNAPKFPQTFSIQFLLTYYHTQKERTDSHAHGALQQALLSLDKMVSGGIYDQLGGGFSRYSTDKEWLAPHFEKMLYDNALLVSVLSETYQLTKNKKYKTVIEQTLAFIRRELMHPQKGFYAALDADSEGEEGKFYLWNVAQVNDLLGDDARIFCAYYDITEIGNWESKNILRVLKPLKNVAEEFGISEHDLMKILNNGRKKLMEARARRVRPALDDKIILSWNALMNSAYSKAFAATGNLKYKALAMEHMQFLLQSFAAAHGRLYHVWKDGKPKFPAFLDDYSAMIQALLQLHRITGDVVWLEKAKQFCEIVIDDFSEENGFFYFTPKHQQDAIFRKKEIHDGATPSGNALMAHNLLELGLLFDYTQWISRAEKMMAGVSNMAIKHPGSFGVWLNLMQLHICGIREIVLAGEFEKILPQVLQNYLPGTLLMCTPKENDQYPLLRGKKPAEPTAIYLCEGYACKAPVYSVEALMNEIAAASASNTPK